MGYIQNNIIWACDHYKMLVVLHPYFPAKSMEARFSLEILDLYLEFLKFNTDNAFQSLSISF